MAILLQSVKRAIFMRVKQIVQLFMKKSTFMEHSRQVHSWNRAEKYTHGTENSTLMEQSRKVHSWNRVEKYTDGTE